MEILLYFILCNFYVSNAVHDAKGFDDTVLFDIDWPGNKLDQFDISGSEHIIVTSSHQEKYKCILPNIQEKESSSEEIYDGPTALELLSPLFKDNFPCSYRLESYWTYGICHGRFIRQFHEEREGKTAKLQEYMLGRWDDSKYQTLLQQVRQNEKDKTLEISLKKIDNVNLPYFEIIMDNGTLCDLNQNKPRITKVLYVCYIHGKQEVYSLKETSTCQYEIIILTPLLCSHPKYKPKETGENKINCIPLGHDSKKPHNLLKLKAESAKLRRNSDLDRFRVELVEIEKLDIPTFKDKPLIDSSQVESFLSGKNCLYGGTGWWKYEFCYGKSVSQYHIEKDGQRITINLGKFDKEKHLEWIEKFPNKRPKPLPQRTQLSHFYSGGDVCDKTGRSRQTEVKLKCLENSSSQNAVSLYLLEPKSCEYILGVESPLICDILSRADENGLVEDTRFENELPSVNIKL